MLDAGHGFKGWQEFSGLAGNASFAGSFARYAGLTGGIRINPKLAPGATFFCPLRGFWAGMQKAVLGARAMGCANPPFRRKERKDGQLFILGVKGLPAS